MLIRVSSIIAFLALVLSPLLFAVDGLGHFPAQTVKLAQADMTLHIGVLLAAASVGLLPALGKLTSTTPQLDDQV